MNTNAYPSPSKASKLEHSAGGVPPQTARSTFRLAVTVRTVAVDVASGAVHTGRFAAAALTVDGPRFGLCLDNEATPLQLVLSRIHALAAGALARTEPPRVVRTLSTHPLLSGAPFPRAAAWIPDPKGGGLLRRPEEAGEEIIDRGGHL